MDFKHLSKASLTGCLMSFWAASAGFAQNGTDGTNTTIGTGGIQDVKGTVITKENMADYATLGNPGTISADTDEYSNKIFALYNVGTGRFLIPGNYWGSKASLGDVPTAYWLQRRTTDQKTNHKAYLHYPETEGESFSYVPTSLLNVGWDKAYVGSQEGKTVATPPISR